MSLSADTLSTFLQTLPQELYDRIYELTFTADKAVHVVHEKMPRGMHGHRFAVDRTSRELFAQSYYGGGSAFIGFNYAYIGQWLDRLPSAHRKFVRNICRHTLAFARQCYPDQHPYIFETHHVWLGAHVEVSGFPRRASAQLPLSSDMPSQFLQGLGFDTDEIAPVSKRLEQLQQDFLDARKLQRARERKTPLS
jgi:hypothetical protein